MAWTIYFRRQLSSEGISEQAIKLISASRRKNTISRYESAWRKWSSWCNEQIDPFRCPLDFILDFLSVAFSEGLQHSTIAGYGDQLLSFSYSHSGLKWGIIKES